MINKISFYKCWCLILLSVLSTATLGIIGFSGKKAFAQSSNIIPDNTLGAESSEVTENVQGLPIEVITGGAERGINLFHSFQEFNVSDGRGAYLFSPNADIQNILARVTGGNPSEILGTLGTFGDSQPNLFLINPSGIVFGENASLDVGGSFVASTANGINLGETALFSATEPEKSSLLSVNPSALFFNAVNNQAEIVNRSRATTTVLGFALNGDTNRPIGLQVLDGKSLLLVGGDISLNGGSLGANGGNIELASVASPGRVELDISGNTFRLNVPQDIKQGDISFKDLALVSVSGAGGGNLLVNARNLELLNSFIFAGIAENSGNPDAQAGDISLEASNSISLVESIVSNGIEAGGFGKSGNINITSASLSLSDASRIRAVLRGTDIENNLPGGQGETGNININVRDTVSIAGIEDKFNSTSIIFNSIGIGAIGNAGDININAGSLSLTEGSEINAKTLGQGNAGNITVNARQNISLDGSGDVINVRDGSNATIFTRIISSVDPEAVGNAGNIQLNTGTLEVTNRAVINSGTNGEGGGGNITINALDTVIFDMQSQIRSTVDSNVIGNSGDISIKTGELLFKNGAFLRTFNGGQGNAGNIFLDVRDTITFDGVASNGTPSNIMTFASNGNAGNIEVVTGSLFLANGANMNAAGFGQDNINNIANAGSITINALNTIKFDGEFGGLSSSLIGGVGKGGDIQVTTGSLWVTNGAGIRTSTSGQGNAGNININARDTITFDGIGTNSFSIADSSVAIPDALGKGGDIYVNTKALFLTNGGSIAANSFGKGNAGNIFIDATDSVSLDGFPSSLQTFTSNDGDGGKIELTTRSLSITNRALLLSSTLGKGDAGDIEINASEAITIKGAGSSELSGGLYSRVGRNGEGNGGKIRIKTDSISLDNNAELSVSTSGKGNAGIVEINAKTFEASNGGKITSRTSSQFTAGNIILNVTDKITLTGSDTGIFANTTEGSTGKGGSIFIDPRLVVIKNGSGISVGSNGTGDAGDIFLQAGTLQLDNGNISAQTASTKGGDINLQIGELLLLRNNSQISTNAGTAQQGGDGGNIDINSKVIVAVPQENSDITANAFEGKGGNINIDTQGIFGIEPASAPIPGENDITASSELGITGNINLNAPDNSSIQNSLSDLQQNPIDTNALIANSCIARSRKQESTFNITGAGGLPQRPGDTAASNYPTGEVQNLSDKIQSSEWKPGEPIIEPQGVYELPSGQLILSRECD